METLECYSVLHLVDWSAVQWLCVSVVSVPISKVVVSCPSGGELLELLLRDGLRVIHDEPRHFLITVRSSQRSLVMVKFILVEVVKQSSQMETVVNLRAIAVQI